ncbi:hypothetical protein ACTNDP_10400 [Paenibacillus barengoltzii]|uniref:hypothetical protein n=1 Tax=Paenibacillus barengoltzii TaxID=343517 RepID=UPI003F88AA02
MKATDYKLIVAPNYSPIESFENEELYRHGIFEWNIPRIIKYIAKNECNILHSVIAVEKEFPSGSLNPSHVDSVDLSIPIIQAEIIPGTFIVIDGHHRIAKARKNRVPQLKSYKLTVAQHILFFTSMKSYIAFVEYWNSKAHDMR